MGVKFWPPLLLGLCPVATLAATIEYTFTGGILDGVPNAPPNVWNGPGPEPSSFQMAFDVNTLSPSNVVSYTFADSTINSITANLAATNFTLSLDGHSVPVDPSATFSFSGTQLCSGALCDSYIGGTYGVSGKSATQSVGFLGGPDFFLLANTESELAGKADPLALILNGSAFIGDSGDFTFFSFGNSRLLAVVEGSGRATAVTEPTPLALLLLAGFPLVLVYTHRFIKFNHRSQRLTRETLLAGLSFCRPRNAE